MLERTKPADHGRVYQLTKQQETCSLSPSLHVSDKVGQYGKGRQEYVHVQRIKNNNTCSLRPSFHMRPVAWTSARG